MTSPDFAATLSQLEETGVILSHGGDRRSKKFQESSNRHLKGGKVAYICELLQVSRSSFYNARRVRRDAPDLAPEIEAGRMTLGEAIRIIEKRELEYFRELIRREGVRRR